MLVIVCKPKSLILLFPWKSGDLVIRMQGWCGKRSSPAEPQALLRARRCCSPVLCLPRSRGDATLPWHSNGDTCPHNGAGTPLLPRTPPGTSPVPPGMAPLVLVLSGLSVRDLRHQGPRARLAQGEVAMAVAMAVAVVAVAVAVVAPPSGFPGPAAPGWAAAE